MLSAEAKLLGDGLREQGRCFSKRHAVSGGSCPQSTAAADVIVSGCTHTHDYFVSDAEISRLKQDLCVRHRGNL